ncbi:MAG: transporter substrate-binding domain-containing protein [Clostridia bacterium]|nr:transporter substrate-binding domain-containing protein [Clostridia bacterium]
MKRILLIALTVILSISMVFTATSCSTDDVEKPTSNGDMEKIISRGEFVCGITLFAPMNYCETEGDMSTLTGFDTELAGMVADKLNLDVSFKVINWGNKYIELESGNIDCIWNGFASNVDDFDGVAREDKVDFSYVYLDNMQCVVTRATDSHLYLSTHSLTGKRGTAELGSAGASFIKDNTQAYMTGTATQEEALQAVVNKRADFAVVDIVYAEKVIGSGEYAALSMAKTIYIDPEMYAVGCRKGSDLDESINEALIELLNEGKIEELAEKYRVHISESLLEKKTTK